MPSGILIICLLKKNSFLTTIDVLSVRKWCSWMLLSTLISVVISVPLMEALCVMSIEHGNLPSLGSSMKLLCLPPGVLQWRHFKKPYIVWKVSESKTWGMSWCEPSWCEVSKILIDTSKLLNQRLHHFIFLSAWKCPFSSILTSNWYYQCF